MRLRWLAVAVLLVLFISVILVVVSQPSLIQNDGTPSNISRIRIEGDDDFDPEHGVIGGSGTVSDPYLIEGWQIDGSLDCSEEPCAGIMVQNTTVSFVIENVYVHGGARDNGIWFSSVKNAQVIGTSITTGGDGIHVVASTNVALSGNTIAECGSSIFLSQSHDVLIYANAISGGGQGIVIEDSSHTMLIGNILDRNRANGLLFLHVTNSTVESNIISETAFRGMALFDSLDVVVSRNRIRMSGEDCLYIASSGRTSAIQNEVSNCTWTGVSVYESNENIVKGNIVKAAPSGIVVSDSSRNVVASNTVADTQWGITISSDSQANAVLDNTVSRSAYIGIVLVSFDNNSPDNNVIQGNTISRSGKADLLDNSGGSSNLWRFNTCEKTVVPD